MNLRVSLRNSMPTLLEVSVTLSDSESTAALGFAESWGPASRSADGHSSLHYLHWIFWNAWGKKCRISSEECLRSGRRNTSERIERTYSTPKEVIGALFFSLSLWNVLTKNAQLTQPLIDSVPDLLRLTLCCVWRGQILRHWRIIDDLLARNLRPRNNQWDPENWNQCILWPPDRQGSQDTSGHIIRPLHWIWGLRWEAFRNCNSLEKVQKMPQSCLDVSLARPWESNGKSGRIKNRTAKAEAKQTRRNLSASLCKFGKRVWLGYLGDTCELGTKL